jgi:hypothetical protein
MPKGLLLLLIVVGLISAQPLDSQEIPFAGSGYARSFLRTIYGGLERFTALWCPSGISFLADGGGSDGGSDGGGSDGGGSDGGSSDSTGEGTGNGAGDAASADGVASAGDDAAAGDDATASATADADPDAISDPTSDPTNVAVVPTDPTVNNAVTPELAAIEAIATTDPRGSFSPQDIPAASIPVSGPGGAIPARSAAGPVDVAINAVIVSAAQSPWDAITKANEVRNVIVTGGIIALGKTPIEGEIPGGGPQPAWLRLVPDLRLLNGSMIPPVVPNVIDIRILDCPIQVLNPPEQH